MSGAALFNSAMPQAKEAMLSRACGTRGAHVHERLVVEGAYALRHSNAPESDEVLARLRFLLAALV